MKKRKYMYQHWQDIKRKRKNLSIRMKKMLKMIETEGMVHWSEFRDNYNDVRTVSALMARLMVTRDTTESYYMVTNFTDEQVEQYIKLHKELKD